MTGYWLGVCTGVGGQSLSGNAWFSLAAVKATSSQLNLWTRVKTSYQWTHRTTASSGNKLILNSNGSQNLLFPGDFSLLAVNWGIYWRRSYWVCGCRFRFQTLSLGSGTWALCLHLVRTMGSTCFLSRLRLFGASPDSCGGERLYWWEGTLTVLTYF